MNIVLACNGEGFGHASRIVTLIKNLEMEHELLILSPDSTKEFIQKRTNPHPLYSIPCPGLIKDEDRIRYFKTLSSNMPLIFSLKKELERVKSILKSFGADAVISDFEPYAPRAAKALGIPVLQFNHPGVVKKSPSLWPDALLTKIVANIMMGPYDERLLCSFYQGDIGLLIREEIQSQKIKDSGRLAVYLKDSYKAPAIKILDELGLDYDLFPDKSKNYAQALASCKALITSAGHQSISEAIYLRKPVFVIPQRGQYEQRLNAQMLRKSGRGDYSSLRALKKRLPQFLQNLQQFPKKEKEGCDFRYTEDTPKLKLRIQDFLYRFVGSKNQKFSGEEVPNPNKAHAQQIAYPERHDGEFLSQ